MQQEPLQVLQAAQNAAASALRTSRKPRLVIAGATGVLGNEVLGCLAGSTAFSSTQVLAREPITAGLRGVLATQVPGESPSQWPEGGAEVGVILFDPPRLYYDRERALWTPQPAQLPELATWMRVSGVSTLAIVMPHAPGRLPEALKRGLATLDEHSVAALGFDRLLILRSAHKPAATSHPSVFTRLAHWMLSVVQYMIPTHEQPVRAVKVAELLAVALQLAPAGIHVAAPELVWCAAQGKLHEVARQWLRG